MTAPRIAISILSRIVQTAEKYGPRIQFITESTLKWLVVGKVCYVVNLSLKERTALTELGFSIKLILPEARGKKDLCEVTIR